MDSFVGLASPRMRVSKLSVQDLLLLNRLSLVQVHRTPSLAQHVNKHLAAD
jgi:hypothetical protein